MTSCNDFDGDGALTIKDVYIYYAWYQASQGRGAPANPSIAQTQAKYDALYGNTLPATVVNIPSNAPIRSVDGTQYTDYNGDGSLDIVDVYIYYAWYQASQGRGAPANPNVTQTQAKYDALYGSSLPATVKYIPEMVCITPTPTPTPTPTHCYNHPDFIFNQTQGTYHCSIQGAIDVAQDGDHLKLSSATAGYIEYEQDITLDATKAKNLTIDGQNVYQSGYGSMLKGSTINISSNAAELINVDLSGCNITCTDTLSTTSIEGCTIWSANETTADSVVTVTLSNDNTTFVLNSCSIDGRLSSDPLSSGAGLSVNITGLASAVVANNEITNCDQGIIITGGDCVIDNNVFTNNSLDIHIKDIPVGVMPSIRQNKFSSTPTAVQITSGPTLANGVVDMSYNYWGAITPGGKVSSPNYLPPDTSPYYTDAGKSTLQA